MEVAVNTTTIKFFLSKGVMMKKISKILSVATFAFGAFALVGCGDESTNQIEFDENFEMVLSKASYTYRAKDSTLTIIPAECKASTLGYVVWNRKAEDGDTLKAYRNGDVASVRPLRQYKDWSKYEYSGKSFPKGLWSESKASNQSVFNGKRFLKNGVVESVFRYEGSCFASSLLHQFFTKNSSIVEADSAIAKFYMMFKSEKDKVFNSKEMLDDLRAPSCNRITMYDGDVNITMKNFKSNSGTVSLGYAKKTCDIKFKLRQAYNKTDCESAFGDFQDDKNAARTFDFDTYAEDVDYDIYCIKKLVLSMQEDKKILPRATADESSEDAEADNLARSAVKFVLSGMK